MSDHQGPTTEPVARLRAQLAAHEPRDARESTALERTLVALEELDAPLDEDADRTHVTGSAIVLGTDGRVLLHRHRRLGIWLQPGGHVDPGETCEQAALREVLEETGLAGRLASPDPLHVDVHDAPRGHVHLDVRWLVEVTAGAAPSPAVGESQEVAWFEVEEALAATDRAAGDAIRAAVQRRAAMERRARG